MNSTQVRVYLDKIPGIDHVGVYASDRLPVRVSASTGLIVNTDPHHKSGEHWAAFYLDQDKTQIEYFDSYGLPPLLTDYQTFLRRNARRYIYNERRLQGLDTSVCGHYCLSYLYCRAVLDMTMNDYVQLFDDSPTVNDMFIRRIFDAIFNR